MGSAPQSRKGSAPLPVTAVLVEGQGTVGPVEVSVEVDGKWRRVVRAYGGGGILSVCVHRLGLSIGPGRATRRAAP